MNWSLSDTDIDLTIRIQRTTEKEARTCLQKAMKEIGGDWHIRGQSMVYVPNPDRPEEYSVEIETLFWWPGLERKVESAAQTAWRNSRKLEVEKWLRRQQR